MLRKSSPLRRRAAAEKAQTIIVRMPDAGLPGAVASSDAAVTDGSATATDPKKHEVDPDDIVIIVDKIEGDVIYAIDPRRGQTIIGADDSRGRFGWRKRPR